MYWVPMKRQFGDMERKDSVYIYRDVTEKKEFLYENVSYFQVSKGQKSILYGIHALISDTQYVFQDLQLYKWDHLDTSVY